VFCELRIGNGQAVLPRCNPINVHLNTMIKIERDTKAVSARLQVAGSGRVKYDWL
jgi:hypothetical protein